MSRRIRLFGLLLGAFAMFGLVACSDDGGNGDDGEATGTATADMGDDGEASTVAVSLTEFAVAPSPASVPAGEVTFEATNEGALPHELVVVRTDLAPGEIPADGAHANLEADGVEVVDRTDQVNAGDSESLTVDLDAGTYVLLCNVDGHYAGGMFTSFTVE